ncbi:hypothetical protein MesoLjLc_08980 [Mesorhizobium sp. L-8-10]|uniref:Csu type fimbrial protein n=2 Tax=Mesorhizobium sp. L-8-10 TaxID=2744523 RepID=UPI001935A53D|nr:spore coat U domain-containing protein [Mesorhizobium sp. L-8-10]BCH28968.1 hypothetical protein MesoLjLc_08980 [Mesorhizobium sp. L-8-10]
MMLRPSVFFGLALCGLMLPGVRPSAAQSCSFTVSDINFGTVDTLAGAAVDMTGSVDISCGNTGLVNLQYIVCLNINAGSGGTISGVRQARNPANAPLAFGLYQDASRTTPWGSREQPALGNPVEVLLLVLPLTNGTASRTIYARVAGGQQSAATGLYTSTFAGAEISFNWQTYVLLPPACSAVTANPTRPTFTVRANVPANCLVTAQNIDFGNHGVLSSQVDAASGLGVTCTQGTAYTVGLNNGVTGTGPMARRMTKGAEAVVYGLYKDTGRTQPWGNSGGELVPGTGSGATQNLPVYGRVPAQTTPSPGTYTDTVVVTVTY